MLTGTSKTCRAWASPGVLGRSLGVLGLSLGVLWLSLGVLGLILSVPGLNLSVLGLNLRVLGRVWKSKTSIFRCFCIQVRQHCANAPTLTKHWQERHKSRFFTNRKLDAQTKSPNKITPGAFRTKLPTKIVLKTGLWICRAPFWRVLGLSGVALGRSWASRGSSWTLLGCFLGASWALLGISWPVYGASWVHFGVQGRPGPPFWKVLGHAGLGCGGLRGMFCMLSSAPRISLHSAFIDAGTTLL